MIVASVVVLGFVGFLAYKAIHKDSPSAAPTTTSVNKPIDGISCNVSEQLSYHEHAKLNIFINGKRSPVPAWIGIPDPYPTCFYWLHVHYGYTDGIIHMEYPKRPVPAPTLGQFINVWKGTRPSFEQPPSALTNPGSDVKVYIKRDSDKKGAKWVQLKGPITAATIAGISLRKHDLITVEQGKYVKPPTFNWASVGL